MRKYSVEKPDHHKVACVEEIPSDPRGIAIAVHGFTSSKESPTVQLLLNKLPAAGIGVVGIEIDYSVMAEQVESIRYYLHERGIETVDYSRQDGKWFELLPGDDEAVTIRPAFLQDSVVVMRGIASGH